MRLGPYIGVVRSIKLKLILKTQSATEAILTRTYILILKNIKRYILRRV